jgi:hypothetical protein
MKNKLSLKPTFISQLTALATTMDTTVEYEFDMYSYCKTACCICGHQVKTNKLDLFPLAKSSRWPETKARVLLDDLNYACERLLGESYLSMSVHYSGSVSRRNKARLSNLLNNEQLMHEHLTGESSPKISADYMRMLIGILSKNKLG